MTSGGLGSRLLVPIAIGISGQGRNEKEVPYCPEFDLRLIIIPLTPGSKWFIVYGTILWNKICLSMRGE